MRGSIGLSRTVCSLKLGTCYFPNLLFNVFGWSWPRGRETRERQTAGPGAAVGRVCGCVTVRAGQGICRRETVSRFCPSCRSLGLCSVSPDSVPGTTSARRVQGSWHPRMGPESRSRCSSVGTASPSSAPKTTAGEGTSRRHNAGGAQGPWQSGHGGATESPASSRERGMRECTSADRGDQGGWRVPVSPGGLEHLSPDTRSPPPQERS